MNGLQAIQDRILAEARETAAQIAEQSAERIAEIKAAAEAEANRLLNETQLAAAAQAEALLNRTRSQITMDNRKKDLQTRQGLVDQAITKAGEKIRQLADQEKIEFYWQLLQTLGLSDGEIVLPAADRHLAAVLLDRAGGQLTLSEEDGTFSCGLILRRGRIEENMTLDLLMANTRQELVQIAAAILFRPVSESGQG